MKKLILATLLLLMSGALYAQGTHLKFKGIPIDGNYNDFAQKLIEKDFIQIESSKDGIVLMGNFMATPGVIVAIYPDPTSKNVSLVAAMLEANDNWPSIEGKYNDVVDTYKKKYGEPTEHVEEFTTEVHNDDFYRKKALKEDNCNYRSKWEVEGGSILITLSYFQSNYYVVCAYADEQNTEALRQTVMDDI